MTVRVLGWFARRAWAPVVVAAAVGVQHTADMYAATGEFRWQALRVLIAVCALFTGIVAALTPRSTHMDGLGPCKRCGADPARGWSQIGDDWYCHPDDGPDCYFEAGTMVDLGSGMIVPLAEIMDDEVTP